MEDSVPSGQLSVIDDDSPSVSVAVPIEETAEAAAHAVLHSPAGLPPTAYASSLHDLPLVSGDERRRAFRRAFADLSRETFDGPGPLEGVPPNVLVLAAKTALEGGLLDD